MRTHRRSDNLYVYHNANPAKLDGIDCVVRAISTVCRQTWEQTYDDLTAYGRAKHDMPNANHVWFQYLKDKGYRRYMIDAGEMYSVRDFCMDNPEGSYILGTPGHVVAVIDGLYYDTFDSGNHIPLFVWTK